MSLDPRSSRRRLRSVVIALAVIALLVLCASVALARPGGGSSFSGSGSGSRGGGSLGGSSGSGSRGGGSLGGSSGSSGSGSGSGSSGDDLGDFLFGLILDVLWEGVLLGWAHPVVGLPVLFVVLLVLIFTTAGRTRVKVLVGSAGLVGLLVLAKFSPFGAGLALLALLIAAFVNTQIGKREAWNVASGVEQLPNMIPEIQPPLARAALERIRAIDPDFSVVLFEDHLALLFAEVHRARGADTLDRLAPYVDADTRLHLAVRPVSGVRDVLLGAMRFVRVDHANKSAPIRVLVELEANYTEITMSGKEEGWYVVERWSLARSRSARSRPPKQATVLDCPSCGAPLEKTVGGACKYCNTTVAPGELDWMVESITTITRDHRGPVLTADVEEQGTDLPTVIDAQAKTRLAVLTARDPALTLDALRGRLELVFQQLQIAWSSREWAPIRPFVSDNLFQSLSYWIEAYRGARLRNVTEDARITGVELARVTSDRWFDAVTVRVRATSLDYVVSDDGALVSGSREDERRYTEYWTLIRSVARKGAAGSTLVCPNCGAKLQINMAGHCAHCSVKVTTGEFDWVLSRIEQDESYAG